jgi:two-component system sensor histidine kinase QseC
VHTPSAPSLTHAPVYTGFSDINDLGKHQWRTFVLKDEAHNLLIWVGERDDVRSDLVNRIVRHTVLPNLIGSLLSFECNQQAHLLNTDFAAIDIALQNLITNAVNFSPANGLISVTLALKNDGYELSVSDQGPGISESDRERLFERFYSKGNNQGLGLGLAIMQTVAMRLDGKVRLENRVPTGLISILAISVATQ